MPITECPSCHFTALPLNAHFCPNCGTTLATDITVSQQIGLYALSFFLPPFGILPAIKYLRQPTQKAKMVGVIALVLTVLSIVISLVSVLSVMNAYSSTINQLDSLQGI